MQNKFSLRASAHGVLVALRKKLNLRPKYLMPEIAAKVGLPVDYLDLPAKFGGFIDPEEEPRYIAVNQALPAFEQDLIIARHMAFRAQQLRVNSLAIDKPWKWEMLEIAPPDLKEKLLYLDEEYRAHWSMILFSSGDNFRAFMRQYSKRFFLVSFADNIVAFHLTKLRVRLWFIKTCRKVTH